MDAATQTLDLAMDAPAAFHAASCYAFSCVVADPPWELEMGDSRTPGKDPSNPFNFAANRKIKQLEYPTMTVAEICALKVPAADDAHLYLWTINRYIEQTYAVARAWGFTPSTMLYWLKQPKGVGFGGAYVPCVEPILFCRRGKLPVKSRCERNWWGWPRGKHSAKPEEFQTVVESVSPGPYLEMFARRKRPGWVSWGNEVTPGVELETHNGKLSGGAQEASELP